MATENHGSNDIAGELFDQAYSRLKWGQPVVFKEEYENLAGEWSDHFDSTIKSESTRAKVILGACYLDELLAQFLKIALVQCADREDLLFDGPQAPLGTFSAKIELIARMGLIRDDVKKSLHLVRKIRNEFAHRLTQCEFDEQKILAWNVELNRLTDVATDQRRKSFSDGPVGDFEKSVSWLIFWLKYRMLKMPTACPSCGSEVEHRSKLKQLRPDDH